MPRFLLFGLLFCFSCTQEKAAPTKEDKSSTTFIEESAISRANISVESLTKAKFEDVVPIDSTFAGIKRLCKNSKGYLSDTWEGLNDCSWAIEQARIDQNDLVKRDGDRLLLEKSNGILELQHTSINEQASSYVQFSGYLPANKYYILEQMHLDQCIETKLIHQENDTEYLLKGKVFVIGKEEQLLVYSKRLSNSVRCTNQLSLYGWTSEGLTKYWNLPLKNREVQSIKQGPDRHIYLHLSYLDRTSKKEDFLKIML